MYTHTLALPPLLSLFKNFFAVKIPVIPIRAEFNKPILSTIFNTAVAISRNLLTIFLVISDVHIDCHSFFNKSICP
jgi:hypothetical protein